MTRLPAPNTPPGWKGPSCGKHLCSLGPCRDEHMDVMSQRPARRAHAKHRGQEGLGRTREQQRGPWQLRVSLASSSTARPPEPTGSLAGHPCREPQALEPSQAMKHSMKGLSGSRPAPTPSSWPLGDLGLLIAPLGLILADPAGG